MRGLSYWNFGKEIYLSRWGFSVQHPRKQAYKQDATKVDNWLNVEFPGITERAKSENAEIFFGDETGIQTPPTTQRAMRL